MEMVLMKQLYDIWVDLLYGWQFIYSNRVVTCASYQIAVILLTNITNLILLSTLISAILSKNEED